MARVKSTLSRLDAAVYRIERVAAASAFLLMGGVMFIAVVQRVYANQESRIGVGVLKLAHALGASPDPATVHGPVSLVINLLLTFLLSYAALRTAKRKRPPSRPKDLALALLATLALAGLVKLVLTVWATGFEWAPSVALACMLFVGFLGASLATYEKRHLALEMGEKIWPKPALRYVKAMANLTTATMMVFLLALAVISLRLHIATWLVNPLVGLLQGTSKTPAWIAFLVFPYAFFVMTVRFVGLALGHFRGTAKDDDGTDSEVRAAEHLTGRDRDEADDGSSAPEATP